MNETIEGTVHSGPAQKENRLLNDPLLVSDKEESKKLWLAVKPNLRGFIVAWETKFARETLLQKELDEVNQITLDPKTGKHINFPKMLDKKEDKTMTKNKAYSIVRTKEGWCILTYMISGNKNVFTDSTKPEHKPHAIARLSNMILEDIR